MPNRFLDRAFEDAHASLMSAMKRIQVDLLCQTPFDASRWLESPYFHFNDKRNPIDIHADYIEWECDAPLDKRCHIVSQVDYKAELFEVYEGLAIETHMKGGIHTLDEIFFNDRPTLLPNLQALLLRGKRTFDEAGSPEALHEIANSRRHAIEESRQAELFLRRAQAALVAPAEPVVQTPPRIDGMTEDEIRIGKAVLAKSAQMMDFVMGEGTSEKFLKGEELLVKGEQFVFGFWGSNYNHVEHSFHSTGSVPYKFSLKTLDNELLATGCVVVRGAPVLDQITGLYLYIKSGEEKEILQTTNWSPRSDLFYEYFPKKKGVLMPALEVASHLIRPIRERVEREMAHIDIRHLFEVTPVRSHQLPGHTPQALTAG